METDSPRDRSSFRDVTKLAAPPAKKAPRIPSPDSSGVVDLEALMKSNPAWLDDALSRAKNAHSGHASMPSSSSLSALAAPVLLAPPSLAPSSLEEVPSGVPRHGFAMVAATVAAIALVVAAAGFALKTQASNRAAVPVAAARAIPDAPATHVESPIPPPPPATEVANAPAVAAPAQAASEPAQAADESPTEANASAPATTETTTAGHSRHGHRGVHRAALAHRAAHESAPVAAAPPPPAPTKPVKATSALDAALRSAAGPAPVAQAAAPPPSAPNPAPAASPSASGDRPDRPSGSAVTSALTGALPGARACLSGGADPSHARVTFGSDGGVKSVDVTGPAASDAKAMACIRSAFGRAHVPPFAQSTYAAGVNVRPR